MMNCEEKPICFFCKEVGIILDCDLRSDFHEPGARRSDLRSTRRSIIQAIYDSTEL